MSKIRETTLVFIVIFACNTGKSRLSAVTRPATFMMGRASALELVLNFNRIALQYCRIQELRFKIPLLRFYLQDKASQDLES